MMTIFLLFTPYTLAAGTTLIFRFYTIGNMSRASEHMEPESRRTKRLRQVTPSPFLVHPSSSLLGLQPSATSQHPKRGHALTCVQVMRQNFTIDPLLRTCPSPANQFRQSQTPFSPILRIQSANLSGPRGVSKNDTRNPHPRHHVSAPLAAGGTRRRRLTVLHNLFFSMVVPLRVLFPFSGVLLWLAPPFFFPLRLRALVYVLVNSPRSTIFGTTIHLLHVRLFV